MGFAVCHRIRCRIFGEDTFSSVTLFCEKGVFFMKKSISFYVAIGGLLTAIGGLLTGPLAIPINFLGGYAKSVSFGPSIIMLAGALLGPLGGFLVGAGSDIISCILIPKGAYFPGFSIASGLIGLIPGLFLYGKKEITYLRSLLSSGITLFVASFCINSALLIFVFHISPAVILLRAGVQLVMIPIHAWVVRMLFYLAQRHILSRGA